MSVQTLADNWVSSAKKRNRALFSELDVLLPSLDRFFNIENLPLSEEDVANRNFFDELSAVRDVILRIIGILDLIIPETRKNVYWFQKFVHSKFLTDKKRDALREELYKQDMPEKSLFLLYDFLINLKGIITDIMKAEHISYLTYANIGQMVGRELRENIYFNPFKQDLNPEFDVIENREISRVVKGIKDKEIKKYISVILLHLFKFLRYLRYANTSTRFSSLNSSLLIILLLRSEFNLFIGYLDKVALKFRDESFRMLVMAISYQFSMETKRVFLQELKEVFKNRSQQYLKSKVENSHGILRNLSEQSIVQIVHFFNPDIRGSDIFDRFVTKFEQSLRLREDVLILHRFLTLVEKAASKEERCNIFDSMRNFMLYFQSFTFKLLRYNDYEEFSLFFSKVLAFSRKEIDGRGFDRLLDKIGQFTVFIGTCLKQISNRAELADLPVDMKKVENSLKQYLQ